MIFFFFFLGIPLHSLIHFNVPRSVSPSQNSQLRLLNTLPLTLHCTEVYNPLPLGVSVWPDENDVHVRMSHPSSCREWSNSIPPHLPYYSDKKMSRLYSTRSDLNDVRTGEVTIKKTSQMSINPKIMNKKPYNNRLRMSHFCFRISSLFFFLALSVFLFFF